MYVPATNSVVLLSLLSSCNNIIPISLFVDNLTSRKSFFQNEGGYRDGVEL